MSDGCCTRTSLTEKCQDIADGIQKMDALERATSHELEAAIRGACGPERQQSLGAVRRVRDLAADRATSGSGGTGNRVPSRWSSRAAGPTGAQARSLGCCSRGRMGNQARKNGAPCWDRTSDPHRVKVVLYR